MLLRNKPGGKSKTIDCTAEDAELRRGKQERKSYFLGGAKPKAVTVDGNAEDAEGRRGKQDHFLMEKQVQKQRSILKRSEYCFFRFKPKKFLILSVEEGLGFGFSTQKNVGFRCVLCVLCGLCGEDVLEVGFPNKCLCISLRTSVAKRGWFQVFQT